MEKFNFQELRTTDGLDPMASQKINFNFQRINKILETDENKNNTFETNIDSLNSNLTSLAFRIEELHSLVVGFQSQIDNLKYLYEEINSRLTNVVTNPRLLTVYPIEASVSVPANGTTTVYIDPTLATNEKVISLNGVHIDNNSCYARCHHLDTNGRAAIVIKNNSSNAVTCKPYVQFEIAKVV